MSKWQSWELPFFVTAATQATACAMGYNPSLEGIIKASAGWTLGFQLMPYETIDKRLVSIYATFCGNLAGASTTLILQQYF